MLGLLLVSLFNAVYGMSSLAAWRFARTVADPLGKAEELLCDMMEEITHDSEKDAREFAVFDVQSRAFIAQSIGNITTANQSLTVLTQELYQLDYQMNQMQAQLARCLSDKTKVDNFKFETEETRKKEVKFFETSKHDLERAISQLENSLQILVRQQSGSLMQKQNQMRKSQRQLDDPMSVARSLRDSLMKIGVMSDSEQMMINQFFAAARDPHPVDSFEPSFLQTSEIPDSLVALIESSLQNAKGKLLVLLQNEQNSTITYKAIMQSYTTQLTASTSCQQEVRAQVNSAGTRREQAQLEKKYQASLLSSMQMKLAEIERSLHDRTAGFRERTAHRSDEILACQEALQILRIVEMQSFRANQTIGNYTAPAARPLALLQVRERARQVSEELKVHAPQISLALLALGSKKIVVDDDPFAKVKTMIREMIQKLQTQHAQEQKHKEWCDQEMTETTSSTQSKLEQLKKSSNKLSNMQLTLNELEENMAKDSVTLRALKTDLNNALIQRKRDAIQAEEDISTYKNAVRMVKHIIQGLTQYYKGIGAKSAIAKRGYFSGVNALLEIAHKDFDKQRVMREQEEALAQQNYESFRKASEIEIVRTDTKAKHDASTAHTLKRNILRENADMESTETEVTALKEYMKQLQASCTAKVDSYMERKAARDAEIAALREALGHLREELA